MVGSDRSDAPYLLTPGPLTTAPSVRQAMLTDWGSWDDNFRALTRQLRDELLEMAEVSAEEYDCIPMQGSGTFVVEAMLGSLLPKDSHTLVLANGAYGQRIAQTLGYLDRAHTVIDKGDYLPPRAADVDAAVAANPAISHIVVVHCETSSGIENPIAEIAAATKALGRKLLVDSMSGFGALELDCKALDVEAFVSSANKCIHGVPGFGFVVAKITAFEAAKGNSHSLRLDLHHQREVMNSTGQWRYTPPTHVLAAFIEALRLHRQEGGRAARLAKYVDRRDRLVAGMRALGFETLLIDRWLSPIIVTFFNPAHENFDFKRFYDLMKQRDYIIYPGKLTIADSFRLGCIGELPEDSSEQIVAATAAALKDMDVPSAAPPPHVAAERERQA